MLVDHMPVLAANLVYNIGVTRSTETAANEVCIAKLLTLIIVRLLFSPIYYERFGISSELLAELTVNQRILFHLGWQTTPWSRTCTDTSIPGRC